MGWLRKTVKKIGRGIKKIGKKIGKAFKGILKPFAKMFNKLGPLGSIAMMFILPGIGQMIAGWGATLGTTLGGGTLANLAGQAVKFVGNAINFVATAPQKIFQTITGAVTNGWNGLFTDPIKGGAKGGDWWTNFKADMKSAWTGSPVTDITGKFGPAGDPIGGDTFWDVSKAGQARLANVKDQFVGTGGLTDDLKNLFKGDPRTALTEANAKTTLDKTEFAKFMKEGSITSKGTTYKLDRTGFFGNLKDVTSGVGKKIGDITVPGVGDVRDIAWGTSAAIGAYQAYSQISPDDPQGSGAAGLKQRAEDQLGSLTDQGGLYNITAPAWSYDFNQSLQQNQQSSRNTWNNAYGLPQGFDPSATPGWGFGYDQWFMESMGFAPARTEPA